MHALFAINFLLLITEHPRARRQDRTAATQADRAHTAAQVTARRSRDVRV